MGAFKFDSPVMEFIGKVVDFILLNFLWVVCCIPIITIGAATSAKYAGSMRILRGEDNPVIKSFFKDFRDNFKQATKIWIVLLAVIALVAADWLWMSERGVSTLPNAYIIAVVVLTLAVIGVYMSIFAFIARFTVTTKEAWKGGILFSLLHIVQLALIAAVEIGTFIACFWYMRYLPLILLFGTTTAFYFNTYLLVKEFGKAEEAALGKKEGEDEETEDSEESEDSEEGVEAEEEDSEEVGNDDETGDDEMVEVKDTETENSETEETESKEAESEEDKTEE